MYHSRLGVKVMKKKKNTWAVPNSLSGSQHASKHSHRNTRESLLLLLVNLYYLQYL